LVSTRWGCDQYTIGSCGSQKKKGDALPFLAEERLTPAVREEKRLAKFAREVWGRVLLERKKSSVCSNVDEKGERVDRHVSKGG